MLKCFEYQYNNDNGPDTHSVFVFAETEEEAVAALQTYDCDVTDDDVFEVNPNGDYFKRWARHSEVYHVSYGELVSPGAYDSLRDYMIDRQLDRA